MMTYLPVSLWLATDNKRSDTARFINSAQNCSVEIKSFGTRQSYPKYLEPILENI